MFLLVIDLYVLFLFYETEIQLPVSAPPNVVAIKLIALQNLILVQIL